MPAAEQVDQVGHHFVATDQYAQRRLRTGSGELGNPFGGES